MTSKNHSSTSATDLARHTREHLAEIRVAILSIAVDSQWDKDLLPKVKRIEKSLAKVFRGINALLLLVNARSKVD